MFSGDVDSETLEDVYRKFNQEMHHSQGQPIVFATRRGYGDFKGLWEFPGGKIEAGETPEKALKREIKEELDADIMTGNLVYTIEYDYPKFHLSMDCFWSELVSSEFILKEHEEAKWLTKDNLDSVEWLPADLKLISILKSIEW